MPEIKLGRGVADQPSELEPERTTDPRPGRKGLPSLANILAYAD